MADKYEKIVTNPLDARLYDYHNIPESLPKLWSVDGLAPQVAGNVGDSTSKGYGGNLDGIKEILDRSRFVDYGIDRNRYNNKISNRIEPNRLIRKSPDVPDLRSPIDNCCKYRLRD